MRLSFKKNSKTLGWGDGSIGKVFAAEAQKLKSDLQNPCEKTERLRSSLFIITFINLCSYLYYFISFTYCPL